ncbi:MAG: S46 family peptidase, partial [Xanthomonadales bacterium]|nr:S46 family peptidase [Xanthomonadales bacterium]
MNIPRAGKRLLLVPFTSVLLLTSTAGFADEGMWTLHDFPTEAVKTRHGVTIGEDWLNEVQRSTARLDGGCTGSFASAQGLVLTNNHCTWGCIRDLSTEDKNLS